jgi:phage virion morphogenesis protein
VSDLQLTIEIDASQLSAALHGVAEALDEDEVLDEAASIILNHTRQRFLEEVNPEGVAWPPSQAAIQRRRGGGTGTLFDTGTLWRSIQESDDHGPGERIIKAGAFTEKGVEYGKFHQYGTKFLPVREFMGVPKEDVELFEARIMQRVAEALGLA